MKERQAGILCPLFSAPGNQGIGDLGAKTKMFIDVIADAGYTVWQILPIQYTGRSHSPYQSYSSFAGDPIYINIDRLCEVGLLTQSSIVNCNKFKNRVEYDKVREFKEVYFRRAFRAFKKHFDAFRQDYEQFEKEAFWLNDWAHFYLFATIHHTTHWQDWPVAYRDWFQGEHSIDLSDYADELAYIKFLQFMFYRQLNELCVYAHQKGVSIMGDVPFYVDLDSADVWSNRADFMLDEKGNPQFVAGCPPDYFSEDGQRWGMPTYNFEHMSKNDYAFWVKRMSWMHRCFDIIRIDHFRAFANYWRIPADSDTARIGTWIDAPGEDILKRIRTACPNIQLVAEDLGGDIVSRVYDLEKEFDIPGMEVIVFQLETKLLRKPIRENVVLYSGTHDNATINESYAHFSNNHRISLRRFFKKRGYTHRKFNDMVCHFLLDSEADLVILPIWDICGYKEEARINVPSTLSDQNWIWKLKDFKTFPDEIKKTKEWIKKANR
ncbi:MAG: 4-alpha-glucanotransferase [Absicoccus sp.]|uniref:4-alpha-glucanotransferase n=1 Tax=Absicoccus intestinalis TaxID=2926319 RepID=A0ABU4WNI0_9FIRM|nr:MULTISPECIES: 4-alpha-glucanotransferase [unclassified Absicoccus]MDX8418111.1 4-alpha-glucanotransferase [Absicoccus sp. CLA-KB-P134]MDY3035515.1 4-alpha-glucanotransferase [Absicoccus sp.]